MASEDIPDDLVELGVVRGAFGVKGWAKVEPFDAQAAVLQKARQWWLMQTNKTPRALQVDDLKPHGATLLAKWAEWEIPESVDAIKGATVAVSRSVFPKAERGEVYWVDLIGAQVVNRQDVVLGTVSGLRSNGVQDLLEVQGADSVLLIPMIPVYVDEVDVPNKRIRVDWQQDW